NAIATGVQWVDSLAVTVAPPRPALSMVVSARPPDAWTNTAQTAPTGIGLNISEPMPNDPVIPYYTEPTHRLSVGTGYPFDAYWDDPADASAAFPDTPFDSGNAQYPLARDNAL